MAIIKIFNAEFRWYFWLMGLLEFPSKTHMIILVVWYLFYFSVQYPTVFASNTFRLLYTRFLISIKICMGLFMLFRRSKENDQLYYIITTTNKLACRKKDDMAQKTHHKLDRRDCFQVFLFGLLLARLLLDLFVYVINPKHFSSYAGMLSVSTSITSEAAVFQYVIIVHTIGKLFARLNTQLSSVSINISGNDNEIIDDKIGEYILLRKLCEKVNNEYGVNVVLAIINRSIMFCLCIHILVDQVALNDYDIYYGVAFVLLYVILWCTVVTLFEVCHATSKRGNESYVVVLGLNQRGTPSQILERVLAYAHSYENQPIQFTALDFQLLARPSQLTFFASITTMLVLLFQNSYTPTNENDNYDQLPI